MLFFGCRCSFCFICYMFCAVFLFFLSFCGLSCDGVSGGGWGGGVGYFANMSVIEHKRVTCCAVCFCGLSCDRVSGGRVGGVGYFANMSVIEHKRVTCCAVCFCGLSCDGVSGGRVGGVGYFANMSTVSMAILSPSRERSHDIHRGKVGSCLKKTFWDSCWVRNLGEKQIYIKIDPTFFLLKKKNRCFTTAKNMFCKSHWNSGFQRLHNE